MCNHSAIKNLNVLQAIELWFSALPEQQSKRAKKHSREVGEKVRREKAEG